MSQHVSPVQLRLGFDSEQRLAAPHVSGTGSVQPPGASAQRGEARRAKDSTVALSAQILKAPRVRVPEQPPDRPQFQTRLGAPLPLRPPPRLAAPAMAIGTEPRGSEDKVRRYASSPSPSPLPARIPLPLSWEDSGVVVGFGERFAC